MLVVVLARGEFAGAALERLGLLAEGRYARGAGVLGHGAGLERAEVAVYRCSCLGELALHGVKLGLLLVVACSQALVCVADRLVDQVVIV
ncbi:MAG TPA: hypothetical protein VNY52_01860 [Solirubrobacteraceae bacterium]|nr:hypothetical protein [Solirubrobacteraceae bacterium]